MNDAEPPVAGVDRETSADQLGVGRSRVSESREQHFRKPLLLQVRRVVNLQPQPAHGAAP